MDSPSKKKSKFILLLLALLATIAVAQIYKWVDEKGRVHFGDQPPESSSVEELELPQGPSAEEVAQAQREARERLEAQKLAGESKASEINNEESHAVSKEQIEPFVDALDEDNLVCGNTLPNFVPSESGDLFSPIHPTLLSSEQTKLLNQLFAVMDRSWKGEKSFFKCVDSNPASEVKTERRDAISSAKWGAKSSFLEFKTVTLRNAKATGTLFMYYKVEGELYFYPKSVRGGGGNLSSMPPSMIQEGNKVEIISITSNSLVFLIKPRNRKGILAPEIHYLKIARNKLTLKQALFVNDSLTGWVITELSK
jgi:uncharacterized protein DUF4124